MRLKLDSFALFCYALGMEGLLQSAKSWVMHTGSSDQVPLDAYCETRDIFQARLERMTKHLLDSGVPEEKAYLISAIAGEIGSNSFDHNAGNWPSVPGVWFSYEVTDKRKALVALADKGRGVLQTLTRVLPDLEGDGEALKAAFTKKISGRAPENRGNGLKFVRASVSDTGMNLRFFSGNAQAILNGGMDISRNDRESIPGCLALLESEE